jgi:hypothetical protein
MTISMNSGKYKKFINSWVVLNSINKSESEKRIYCYKKLQ